MPYARKIVLHCPDAHDLRDPRIDALVEDFIPDGVRFVGVVGKDCSPLEDLIDELVVRDGGRRYDLLTSSHPGETVEQAIEFAKSLTSEFEGPEVQVVEV